MRFLQPERKNKLSTGCRNQRIEELINPSWGINSLTQRRLTDGFLFSAVSLCEENLLCPSYQHFSLFSSLFRCLFYNERKRREKTCGRSWEKDFTLLLTNHDFGFTARLNEAIPKMIGYQAVNPLFLWLEGQRICLVIPFHYQPRTRDPGLWKGYHLSTQLILLWSQLWRDLVYIILFLIIYLPVHSSFLLQIN